MGTLLGATEAADVTICRGRGTVHRGRAQQRPASPAREGRQLRSSYGVYEMQRSYYGYDRRQKVAAFYTSDTRPRLICSVLRHDRTGLYGYFCLSSHDTVSDVLTLLSAAALLESSMLKSTFL